MAYEDGARSDGAGVIGNCCTDGSQTVNRGDTSSHAMRFDGHGKAGTKGAMLFSTINGSSELLTAVFFSVIHRHSRCRCRDDGQRHLLNGHVFGGENHVAFVSRFSSSSTITRPSRRHPVHVQR